MIIINLISFFTNGKEEFIHNKIQEIINDSQTQYFFSYEKKNSDYLSGLDNCTFLSYEEDKAVREKFSDENELVYVKAYHNIEELDRFYEKHIQEIMKHHDIEIVYSYTACYSLEKVCQKYGLFLKYIENATLRRSEYYNFDMIWLTDKQHTNSKEEGRVRYKNFCEQKDKLVISKPIPSKSLLLLGAKKEHIFPLIKAFLRKEEYQLGVAMPCTSRVSNCGWTAERILRYVDELDIKEEDLLIRQYPDQHIDGIKANDDSSSALDFISKCSCVMSSGSNITFEAMMLGKKVIDLGDIFYSSQVYHRFQDNMDDTIYDDWFVNFMFFSVFVHENRLFDQKYIAWRKTEPSEAEIFNDNYDYFFNQLLEEDYQSSEVYDWKKIVNRRKVYLNEGKSEKWEFISILANINWAEEENVFVCGIGKKAVLVKQTIQKLGGRVSGFVVTDQRDEQEYAGLPVYRAENLTRNPKYLFFISASLMSAQIEIFMNLYKLGFERIIV